MVVDKRNLTLAQVLEEAYKEPQSDYASGFAAEIRKNGVAVRNRGPVGVRGTGKKRVFLNKYVMGKKQKDGRYAYKEVIDSEYPIRPNSRWLNSFRKTRAPASRRCTCKK